MEGLPSEEEIYRNAQSSLKQDRLAAAKNINKYFLVLRDRDLAWQNLIRLSQDEDEGVSWQAATALSQVFLHLADKDLAWQDLHRLTEAEDQLTKEVAAYVLGFVFSFIPDKNQAWCDLHRLTNDVYGEVIWWAAQSLSKIFAEIPEKDVAWQDLLRLAQDTDLFTRMEAKNALVSAFPYLVDKQQAWNELMVFTKDHLKTIDGAGNALGHALNFIPNKAQAWQDLHLLTEDQDNDVRREAAKSLGSAFPSIPDKGQAWQDLLRLMEDQSDEVRGGAVESLGLAFPLVSDKTQAWKDFHRLTEDQDHKVRRKAAKSLGSAFPSIPDKGQALEDLHRLTKDQDNTVREETAKSLASAFSSIPDKSQAWQDLHELTMDQESLVRLEAIKSLTSIFPILSDKQQAWEDILRLTQEDDILVQIEAAGALDLAFPYLPDRDRACQDLIKLAKSSDSDVRAHAFYNLGKASILNASLAKDIKILKSWLDNAIFCFNRSSNQASIDTPSEFCYPFYKAYNAIIFQEKKEDEVQMYLAEANASLRNSKNKKELLEVIDNLARALQESQQMKDKPYHKVISEFSAYSWYCQKAAEHMVAVEKEAPVAVKLMRKCNPLLEEKIRATIDEIQNMARQICQTTRNSDTEFGVQGAEIYKAAKALSTCDLVGMAGCSTRMVMHLKKLSSLLPKAKKSLVCEVVEEAENEADFEKRLSKMELALTYLSSAIEAPILIQDVLEAALKRLDDVQRINTEVILERLDENQKSNVEMILSTVLRGKHIDPRIDDLQAQLDILVSHLKNAQIDDPYIRKGVDEAYSCIKDPELDIKNKLLVTIPLIPILLTYQGVFEFQSGLNLLSIWNRLTNSFRK